MKPFTPAPKPTKVRSKALRQSAAGEKCTLRLPGICNYNTATVVLAHLPGGGSGTATKGHDIHAAYACSACHDEIDRRAKSSLPPVLLLAAMLQALGATQARMVEKGLLVVKGAEI